MDLLRDPLVLIGMASCFIPVMVYILQKKKKLLTYRILVQTQLISVKPELVERLEILFDKTAIRDVSLVELIIKNTGNQPILSSDFYKNLSIGFNDDACILDANIKEKTPSSLDIEIIDFNKNDKYVLLSPTLLNPGDSITIKMLLTKFNGTVNVDARIAGVSSISEKTEADYSRRLLNGFIFCFIGIALVLIQQLKYPESVIDLALKIAGIGILTSTMSMILRVSGREQQGRLISLGGGLLVITLFFQFMAHVAGFIDQFLSLP